jgi:large subunit ribosomal protein L17
MAIIELVEALTVAQTAVGEAERARGTKFAKDEAPAAAPAAAASDETPEAPEAPEAGDQAAEGTTSEQVESASDKEPAEGSDTASSKDEA